MRLQEPGASRAEEIVPPRPNLGPEPWDDRAAWPGWVGPASLGLVATLVVVRWRLRERRRRPATAGPGPASGTPDADASPRRRLIAASEAVRGALIAAFGPAWGSKTTEEIAAEPGLADRLGPERADGLVAFLRLADRAKFAGDESPPDEEAASWAARFVAGLATAGAARATSTTTGK